MNRLEKLKLELAESQCERLTSTLVDADSRKRHFIKGFDAASAEYEKLIAELENLNKKLNEENENHIKIFELIDEWALAGNIINYTQLSDKIEEIQKLNEFKGDE